MNKENTENIDKNGEEKARIISISELNEIEDNNIVDLVDVYLISTSDIQKGTSKYGTPYTKRDISVGIFEGKDREKVLDEVRITTFDENMIKEFGEIPREKPLYLKNLKKNTFRGVPNLLTTDVTKIEVIKDIKNKENREIKKEEIKKEPLEKTDIKVSTFGSPRLDALKIVRRGLETVLSGIDILIKIGEEEEKREKS
jgi:hypothetical protein